MTLPDLRAALARISPLSGEDVKLRDMFIERMDAWSTDMHTAFQLLEEMKRLLGYVWFTSSEAHQQVFAALEAFGVTVDRIPTMTMNERLLSFGLLEAWNASSEAKRKVIRSKLGLT